MKKIPQCAILLAFALAFVGCNLQDEPKASSLQDALNGGGSVNLDDYAGISSSGTYSISTNTVITGNARGAHFAIADCTGVTFDGTKDIGTVTVGSSTNRNAAVRAATRTGGVTISLKGSGVTIGKLFIYVKDCTLDSENAGNSFGSVVVAETVTSLTLERQTNVSALVSTGEANVKITISAKVNIEKADQTIISAVKENNPNITIDIISDDELKKLQDAFVEESKKNPADGNTSSTTPGNDSTTNPEVILRGCRIAAKYVQKCELAFYADDTAVMTMGWPVSGTYTKEANGDLTVHMPFSDDISDEKVSLAKINGNTLSLYDYNEDGNLSEHALTFTKKATNSNPSAQTEWEYTGPLSLTFALDGTVQFFEDSALCWTGTYTVTEDNLAVTEDIQQVGSPWHNLASPEKVEFTFHENALMWDVLYGDGGASNFLTQAGDLTVNTSTSGGNTNETNPGNNGDNTSETNPGNNGDNSGNKNPDNNDGNNTDNTNPGNNGDNTDATNPDDGDSDDNTKPGGNDDDNGNNVDIIPRGSRIAAEYVRKWELAFYADGTAVMTIGWPVSGTYTKEANGDFTVRIPLQSDDRDEAVYLAKITGNTLSLYYYDEDGKLSENAMSMTKKATNGDLSALTEWEYYDSLSLTFALDGTVQFFEDSALCWTGTYTVTEDDIAVTEDVRQVGSPWGEDDMTSPPLKVEFDFSYKAALSPNVYTSEGGGWSPFLTRMGDMTVKTPTSDKES